MTQPLATCQCAVNQTAPCGVPATQEDLLCDLCRECADTPWAVCAAVTLPDSVSYHFMLLNLSLLW